jgi:hypothetical protein
VPRAPFFVLKAGGALAGAQRVVLLSAHGGERSGVFPYSASYAPQTQKKNSSGLTPGLSPLSTPTL